MTTSTYSPQAIERSIQAYWQKNKTFVTKELTDPHNNFYCLAMIPYPSGSLHMGHVRNYTLSDVIARYQRMKGKNVLHPMGWDAFGLPAENAAIKRKLSPAAWTEDNIITMRKQLQTLGYSIDWEREIKTCDPTYYRWEQWLFLQFYKKGLAYKKNASVNWDPVDNTVLANEQVIDGKGWRSGAPVEKKEIKQWFFKITDYAEPLLEDIKQLTEWPEEVRRMQTNWIGRSTGTEIQFSLTSTLPKIQEVTVFTTRADTLMGVTYVAIAPDHPLVKFILEQQPTLATKIAALKNTDTSEATLSTQDKIGIDSGLFVFHPITQNKLPLWVANFVLSEYGSGAVMCVPAHDARDHAFAKQYQLPIQPVIKTEEPWYFEEAAYLKKGILMHSGAYDGLHSEKAILAITKTLTQTGKGEAKITYRLRDWGISRQRYWGTPIPIIQCAECGEMPVPESDLPVKLPTQYIPDGSISPLCVEEDFLSVPCPKCKKPACRETDTMDTFVESSWYYARYCSFNQSEQIADERVKNWLPVNQYVGGIEHAIMHLLYARFIHKALKDMDIVDSAEPFKRLLTQGMVLKNGEKMSKSKGNSVAPEPLIEKYGADALRFFILFSAPPCQTVEWSDQGVEGAYRFLKRLWTFSHTVKEKILKCNAQSPFQHTFKNPTTECKKTLNMFYILVEKIHNDMERQHFNTVASGAMKLLNLAESIQAGETKKDTVWELVRTILGTLLKILSPLTPHITQFLWNTLGFGADISLAIFPVVDPKLLEMDSTLYVIQINGKRRAQVEISSTASQDLAVEAVKADPRMTTLLQNKTIHKTIFVPKKLINFVVT